MTIASSVISADLVQSDGRRYIHEFHTDHLGGIHRRVFIVSADYDAQANLVANAAVIDEQLTNDEIRNNLEEVDNANL